MNKYFTTLTNERGDVLPNYRAQVVDSTGSTVTIYSDKSGTRFTDSSGNIVNYVTAEANGRVSFYFTAEEGQVLQTLDAAGDLVDSEPDFADNLILANLPGSIAQSAVTGLTTDLAAKADGAATTAALAAKAATADLASTTNGKGASLVSLEDGADLETAVMAQRAIDIRALVGGDGDITATVAAIVSAGYTNARLRTGNYTIAPSTEIGDLHIEGDGAGTVVASSAPSAASYIFLSTGSATAIADLGVDAVAGSNTLTFASAMDAVLSPGDLIQIYNPTGFSWSGFRSEYRAGEFCVVKSVSGTTVKVMEKLQAAYVVAAVDIYLISPKSGGLSNMQIDTGGQRIARFQYGRNNKVANLTAANAAVQGLSFDRCFNFNVSKCDLENYGQASDDYAIAVGNCQDGIIRDCRLYARRHPIDLGGSSVVGCVPTRFIKIVACRLTNDIDSAATCADFHGNADQCEYIDCEISGGATMGGSNNGYTNCRIDNASAGMCVYGAEIKGGDYWVRDCTLITYTDPSTGGRGIIDFSDACLTANTVNPVNIFVRDIKVESAALTTSSAVMRVDIAGSTVAINMVMEGVACDVNALGFVLYTDALSGTADSDRIIVEGVTGAPAGTYLALHIGSHFLNFPHRLQKQSGTHEWTTAAAKSYVSPNITFPLYYPRPPVASAVLAPQGSGSVSAFLGGASHASAYANVRNTTRINVALAADSNWLASQAAAIDWSAGLNEAV